MSRAQPYRGRFAPSPTGPLHAGSLVAALASWLDARAHRGQWLVRIEDVDGPRCPAGMDAVILAQLNACGLNPDEAPRWQSAPDHAAAYAQALTQLLEAGRAFPCACTRQDIDTALAARGLVHARFADRPYPGTCRDGLNGRTARAVRFRAQGTVDWIDRRLGRQSQDVETAVGDFVLRRADGLWAYQLAVVVDDGAQGITHVVRGADLADNTARQILLQRALGLAAPHYMHTPLVNGADGHKLSKQNGAQAVDVSQPLSALRSAGLALGLPDLPARDLDDWLAQAVQAWAGMMRVPN
jgi:glutamyl-Q tRNA(Asp) synthetase